MKVDFCKSKNSVNLLDKTVKKCLTDELSTILFKKETDALVVSIENHNNENL